MNIQNEEDITNVERKATATGVAGQSLSWMQFLDIISRMRFEKLMALMRDQVYKEDSNLISTERNEGGSSRRDGQLLTPTAKFISYIFQNHVKLVSPLDSKTLFKACLEGNEDGELEHVLSQHFELVLL